MNIQDTIQLISAIGTIFLGAVALYALFYPRIHFYFVKPKLSATFDPIDDGKGGLNFQVYNFGNTPAHNVTATIRMVSTKDGTTFGTFTMPWKSYSLGFMDSEGQLIQAKYSPMTIYPNQQINTRGFEILSIGTHNVLGLHTLPYRLPGRDYYPPIFWELDKLPNNIEAKLEANVLYAVYFTLYCDELVVPVQRLVILKWNGNRIIPLLDQMSLEFKKQMALSMKLSKNSSRALIAQEKEMIDMLRKLDKLD